MGENTARNTENVQTQPLQFHSAVEDDEIDLTELFYLLLEHIWQILLCLVLGAIVAFGVTKFFITPQYEATAKIYVVSASNDSVVNLSDLQIGSQLTSDYQELLTVRSVLENVASDLQLSLTYDEMANMITITNPDDTRLLYITVTSPDPSLSANMANKIAELAEIYLPQIMECEAPNLAESALAPTSPSSPSYAKNLIIGAMLVALCYCAVLVIRFLMNDTFKSAEDIEKYLGQMPLCVVPETNFKSKKKSASYGRKAEDLKE